MQARLSGQSWAEAANAFPFVDGRFEFDPFWALAAILVFSVVVSIISAVYYFKLYELMAPPASAVELQVKSTKPPVLMVHENGSIMITAGLVVLLALWPLWLDWDTGLVFFSFPTWFFD